MRLLTFVALIAPALALWPQPTTITNGNSTLLLSNSFSIVPPSNAPSDLQQAITSTSSFLKNDKLGRLVVGRGSSDSSSFGRAKTLRRLVLSFSKPTAATKGSGGGNAGSIASEATKTMGTRDESYTLTVPADGSDATLSAATSLGLFRGLATFSQMWYTFGNTV